MIAEDELAAEAQDWMGSRIVVKVKVTCFLSAKHTCKSMLFVCRFMYMLKIVKIGLQND